MANYQPELGQMAFGQPFKQYEVPDIASAALESLSNEIERVGGNLLQREYESPFRNNGGYFKNDTFEVEAYSWDDSYEQPYNFKWRDLEISWYKYLHRGMSANKEITPDLASEMLTDCLASMRRTEKENFKTAFERPSPKAGETR